jgi:hypothetical protein
LSGGKPNAYTDSNCVSYAYPNSNPECNAAASADSRAERDTSRHATASTLRLEARRQDLQALANFRECLRPTHPTGANYSTNALLAAASNSGEHTRPRVLVSAPPPKQSFRKFALAKLWPSLHSGVAGPPSPSSFARLHWDTSSAPDCNFFSLFTDFPDAVTF